MATKQSIKANNCTVGFQSQGDVIITGNLNVQNSSQKLADIDEFNLPRLIDNFIGRDQEIKKLESLFFDENEKKIVISGLAGLGKTELAKQFAYQCMTNGKVDYIFWIKAENTQVLENLNTKLRNLYHSLKEDKCFYIFDNTISRQSIFELEPPDEDNYLLITSQIKYWHNDVKPFELDYLSSDSAIKVFREILSDLYNEQDCELYSEIAKIVNYMPHGLQVTAAHVLQRKRSMGQSFILQKYVDEIKQNVPIDVSMPEWVANPYTKSLYGALKISLDYIKNEKNLPLRELSLNALYICAFLDPEDISLNDLLKFSNIKELFKQHKIDKYSLREALSLIDNYSFINFDPNHNKIKIHRLIQEVLRYHLRNHETELLCVCYNAGLEVIFLDIDSSGNDSFFKYINILKYVDYNIDIFYNIYQKYKIELFLTHNEDILRYILNYFIVWNCIEALSKLLEDINNCNTNWYMCIRYCLCCKSCTCHNVSYFALLSVAAAHNNVEILELLLTKYKTYVNDQHNDTALHVAARNWNFEAIKVLIKYGADKSKQNAFKEIPLFVFCKSKGVLSHKNINVDDLKEILHQFQCDTYKYTTNEFGRSLLHAAANSYNAELVSLLVTDYKLNVNALDESGNTPLHNLIKYSSYSTRQNDIVRTVEELKTCGASLEFRNLHGKTPRQLAEKLNLNYLIPYL